MRQAVAVALILVFLLAPGNVKARELPPLEVAPFGSVRLYMPQEQSSQVVILLSGEKGWDDVAEGLATRMTALGCLVIGVDSGDGAAASLRMARMGNGQARYLDN